MRHPLKLVALVYLTAWTNHAAAQSIIEADLIEQGGPRVSVVWDVFTGITSSSLAHEGAELMTSSALSWPDGTQAIVTFWRPIQEPYIWANVVRCMDYFDSFMQSTGGVCSIPRAQQ